jgi:hypothetical protein
MSDVDVDSDMDDDVWPDTSMGWNLPYDPEQFLRLPLEMVESVLLQLSPDIMITARGAEQIKQSIPAMLSDTFWIKYAEKHFGWDLRAIDRPGDVVLREARAPYAYQHFNGLVDALQWMLVSKNYVSFTATLNQPTGIYSDFEDVTNVPMRISFRRDRALLNIGSMMMESSQPQIENRIFDIFDWLKAMGGGDYVFTDPQGVAKATWSIAYRNWHERHPFVVFVRNDVSFFGYRPPPNRPLSAILSV